jgi:O-succinylbenzoic acid--CoA ligase
VANLVAIDLPGGTQFVDELRRAWDDGDAVLPVDRRYPPALRRKLFDTLRPTHLVDAHGHHRLDGDPTLDGDALVMATSGSTGTPKGVVLTHDAVRASALATASRLGTTADDTWLACLPLSHVGGLSVVTRALHTGAGLVVHDGFDATAVETAARNGATAVSLVATAMTRIDPSLFRVIVLGGSRPPADRPANSVATYGLTETGSGVVYEGVPLDGVEVRIVDGEVLLRCPMQLRAYRDGTTPVDHDGWLHTHDYGEFTADGRLQVHGRRGDMIVTGGENVWPDAVEQALTGVAGIAEVAVAGVTDHEWGQRVVAWVVPTDASSPPSLDALRERVRQSLPAYCAPKELHLVRSLPRTALGKVQRHRLSDISQAATSEPDTSDHG